MIVAASARAWFVKGECYQFIKLLMIHSCVNSKHRFVVFPVTALFCYVGLVALKFKILGLNISCDAASAELVEQITSKASELNLIEEGK